MIRHFSRHHIVASALTAGLGLLVAAVSAADLPVRRTRVRPSAEGDGFGAAVALDGRTLVLGAGESGVGGEVFVLERSATDRDVWTEVARLAPARVASSDGFGFAVAVSGNTLVAASVGSGTNPGAWIYQRNDGVPDSWGEVAELLPEGGRFAAWGGVAIDGDLAVVGDVGADAMTGAVYLFARDAGGPNQWGQIAKLVAVAATASSWFGSSVAIDGDTLVAGAPFDNPLGEWQGAGAAYVFQRTGGDPASWAESARLSAADGEMSDLFGLSVDLDGNTIVVGAPGNRTARRPPLTDRGGAVYVFDRDRGGAGLWGQAAQVFPTKTDPEDDFGRAVALRGHVLLVGAPVDDDMCTVSQYCETGAAYLFHRSHGGARAWNLQEKFYAPLGRVYSAGDRQRFGNAVDLDTTSGVVGAPGMNRAYVYRRVFP